MSKKILIVDDDVELVELLTEYLSTDDYDITTADNGKSGLEKISAVKPAMIIMDIMMPVMDGMEALKTLRQSNKSFSNTPVIMLTAKGDDIDKIIGLELGADDYLSKPFNPRELKARIQAILRRESSPLENKTRILEVGDVSLNLEAYQVKINDEQIELTATEFDVLAMLLDGAGSLVLKEKLSEQVLEKKLMPFDRSLDMHISNLRKKLGDKNGSTRIKTVRGKGFQYII